MDLDLLIFVFSVVLPSKGWAFSRGKSADDSLGSDNCSEISITFVMPDLIRHPVEKARRRRTFFDWTPDRVRGDGSWGNDKSEVPFGTPISLQSPRGPQRLQTPKQSNTDFQRSRNAGITCFANNALERELLLTSMPAKWVDRMKSV